MDAAAATTAPETTTDVTSVMMPSNIIPMPISPPVAGEIRKPKWLNTMPFLSSSAAPARRL
jgi:hypothetical protein